MSFDDYAQHLAQKYRLAISIAIINIKPTDLTIDEFLDQIKNTINEKNDKDDDFNICACSDDFNIDSDEVKDQNHMNQEASDHTDFSDQNYMNQNRHNYSLPSENNDHDEIEEILVNESQFNGATIATITIHDGSIQINGNGRENDQEIQENAKTQVYSKEQNSNSSNILKNLKEVPDAAANKQRREMFRELIKVLKGDDAEATDKLVINNSQRKSQNSLQTKPFDPNDTDLTQCYDNNTESIDILNDVDKIFEQNRHNQLEDQRNPQNMTVIHKDNLNYPHLYNTQEKGNTDVRKRINNNELCDRESKITRNVIDNIQNTKEINISNINVPEPKITENSKDFEITISETIKLVNDSSNMDLIATRLKDQGRIDPVFIDMDTQETILNTQYNTHYSQSQMNEIFVGSQFIHGNKNTNNVEDSTKNTKDMELDEFTKTLNYRNENPNRSLNENQDRYLENNQIHSKTGTYINLTENDTSFQEHLNEERNIIEKSTALSQNMDLNIPFQLSNNESNAVYENCTIFDQTMNIDRNDCTVLSNEKGCTVFDKTNTDINMDTDLTDGEEKVPFKIIEEMNRIKTYLRRKENKEFSSGYRSSQSKSSFGGTPQSIWIGQSASNVFNYLSNCLLVTSTQHLIEQISETLGQLIDRLHEDETYPAFLEDLLTTVDNTLQLIYEENNYAFDVLLKKDEQMQRILLLNKSSHIQKFTIEKINNILQKSLDNLSTDDTTIEIQNINKIENLCYIFQILQVLLPKYSASSQNSTQNSQDEKILRKKDITDIWRKKWMEKKVDVIEGSFESKCVLNECSAILNKIIINFMDGYTLIAFSALKCFNIMQS